MAIVDIGDPKYARIRLYSILRTIQTERPLTSDHDSRFLSEMLDQVKEGNDTAAVIAVSVTSTSREQTEQTVWSDSRVTYRRRERESIGMPYGEWTENQKDAPTEE